MARKDADSDINAYKFTGSYGVYFHIDTNTLKITLGRHQPTHRFEQVLDMGPAIKAPLL